MRKLRNMLIVIAGFVLLGIVVGLLDRKSAEPVHAAAARVADGPPREPRIFLMEASLEELRKFPAIDGMTRADEAARRALPQGLEGAGRWVKAEDVLEGYAHPNGKRFFVIMKPGDRAYSVFVE
jgi:hypothetical protein